MVPISLVDPTVVAVNLMSDVVLDGEGNKFMAVVDGTSWVGFAVVANVTAWKTEQVAHKYYLRLQKFCAFIRVKLILASISSIF